MLSRVLAAMTLLFVSISSVAEITRIARLPADVPPGNIAVSADGRIFFSVHEFYGKPLKVVELMQDGSTKPYPSQAWASSPGKNNIGLNGVLGLNTDGNGILWLLDGATPTSNARLVAWNTHTESLHRVIYLGFPITRAESFVNDLAIDTKNDAIYITDVSSPTTSALIVVDLKTGMAKRVLEGSQFTKPEDIDMVIDSRVISLGGNPARIGANPITLDGNNEWLYFGAMNGLSVYRIKTADLVNNDLSEQDLGSRVEKYGEKPISDGITVDESGNVYVTSITNNSIGVVTSQGNYKTLYQGDHLSWPDGFSVGPDNTIYVTVNELHLSPVLNNGKDATKGKFAIYRFPALAPAKIGR